MNIGFAIRFVRKKFSISQCGLAKKCEMSQQALSMIEKGKVIPSDKTVSKICMVLDIPELVLYILSTEDRDISQSNRNIQNRIYPGIKGLALQMVNDEHRHLFYGYLGPGTKDFYNSSGGLII
jgi:transcriptional regulator with XRE-family HTH domain